VTCLCYAIYYVLDMEKERIWLIKSEPSNYSIDDLKRDKRTRWDGVRNYQARNFMRDEMKIGDMVLFYHSGAFPSIVGLAKVCSKPYADQTAFDASDPHFDPKSEKNRPVWYLVDLCFVRKFTHPVLLNEIKNDDQFTEMLLVKRGLRLSIQPVVKKHFNAILNFGKSGGTNGNRR
jgi:predicted RNA-binding protein with PUA-like domain